MCHLSLFWVCFVFFFKQKTAYEMRMSDWSSDVCSSDLLGPITHRGQLAHIRQAVARAIEEGAEVAAGGCEVSVEGCPGGYFFAPTVLDREIGRASCRERVCQYV